MLDQVVHGRGGLVPFIISPPPERARRMLARCALQYGALLIVVELLGVVSGPAATQEARRSEPSQTKRKVPEGLSFAHALFRQRKFEMAAEEYRRFLDSGPTALDAADARFGRANALLFQGRYKDARSAFEEFVERTPDGPRATYGKVSSR